MARRVVLILVDGLRPDVVKPDLMPRLWALSREYTRADLARTIRPSVTVAALASLATGVRPDTHRLTEPGLGFLPALRWSWPGRIGPRWSCAPTWTPAPDPLRGPS